MPGSEEVEVRGLEKFTKKEARDVGETATSGSDVEVRGLEKFGAEPEEAGIIPEGYKIAPEIVEQIEKIAADPSLRPYEDREGILAPGTVLINPKDPEQRRLITNLYYNNKGFPEARVHIEGSIIKPQKIEIVDLRSRIAEGRLVLPKPPETK